MGSSWRDIASKMPCFIKKNLLNYIEGSINTFNDQIQASVKKGEIFKIKNGMYMSKEYFDRANDKTQLLEYIAGQIKSPSYLSKEYVMQKYSLLTESTYTISSITKKTRDMYNNVLGTFIYSNIKDSLYFGFEKRMYLDNVYYEANKSKAVFDYLYLKKNIGGNLKEEILDGLRINWISFSKQDFVLFNGYCIQSKSKKMLRIANILKNNIYK